MLEERLPTLEVDYISAALPMSWILKLLAQCAPKGSLREGHTSPFHEEREFLPLKEVFQQPLLGLEILSS